MTDHEPGCPLHAVPWLDDATRGPDAAMDRAAAAALSDALDGVPEMDLLAEARLAAVLRHVAPTEEERRPAWCTCRRRGGPDGGPR